LNFNDLILSYSQKQAEILTPAKGNGNQLRLEMWVYTSVTTAEYALYLGVSLSTKGVRFRKKSQR